MHPDQVDLDAAQVTSLVAAQFPGLAGLPVSRVRSTGTVNAIYRVGADLCARLPLVPRWAEDLRTEVRWLPELAGRLTLQVPEPVALGQPGAGYPFHWALYHWIEGQPYAGELIADERRAAEDMAQFVRELRAADVRGDAPAAGRRPLSELDAETREAIESARGVVDAGAALRAWVRALQAPAWDGRRVWIHADLMRPNLLVRNGRLAAVIDFGAFGAGDPAADVIPAWEVFGEAGRQAFRAALGVDDGTWARARGYALHQAAMIIPYYAETNPEFVALARQTVGQVLGDADADARAGPAGAG